MVAPASSLGVSLRRPPQLRAIDGQYGSPSPANRAVSVPCGLDAHRDRAATPLDIVRDARGFLGGASPLQPRRRAMMLDPSRHPFEEAEQFTRLPSLGIGRSSSSGATSSGSAPPTRGFQSAPPTRGSPELGLLSPLEQVPSPPATDPPRRLRKKKKSASAASLIPAMPDSPLPLPPGTSLGLHALIAQSPCSSPPARAAVLPMGSTASLERSGSEAGASPLVLLGAKRSPRQPKEPKDRDLSRADEADTAAGRLAAALAAAAEADSRYGSKGLAPCFFPVEAAPETPEMLRLARTLSGGSIPFDMSNKSLNSVLTQKLSNPDCADMAAGLPLEIKKSSPLRRKTSPLVLTKSTSIGKILNDSLPCSESCGLVRARSDCDYWDDFSQAGSAKSHSHGNFFDSVDGREVQGVLRTTSMFPGANWTVPRLDGHVEMFQTLHRDDVVRGAHFSWVRGEMVGRGSLGCVWKALNRDNGQLMAVKEVVVDTRDKDDEKFRAALQNEVDLCKDLKHPHIVSYLGNDYLNGRLFIYLEYMPGGCLAQILSQFGPLDEPIVARYARDVLVGLEYLHTRSPPVLHRDIKGANILVGLDLTVKLSDFGCSKRSAGTMVQTLRGSVPWMAPEVMRQSDYGRKADIWSFGCVIIEMATAAAPWGSFDNHLAAMVRIAMSNETPPVPGHLSGSLKNLIMSCTRRAPEGRPGTTELLGHEFFEGCQDGTLFGMEDSWG